MIKLILLIFITFVLVGCQTEVKISEVLKNSEGQWEVHYSDGSIEVLETSSQDIVDVTLDEDNRVVLIYSDDESHTLDITLNYYNVTFKSEGKIVHSDYIKEGEVFTYPLAPRKTGHTFSHWDQEIIPVQEELTIHAVYTPNEYIVRINTYLEAAYEVSVPYGEKISLPTLSYENHVLEGIYTDAAFKNPLDLNQPVTSNMLIYYHWLPVDEYYTLDMLLELFEVLNLSHYQGLSKHMLLKLAMEGLIDSLEDPYTLLLKEEDYQAIRTLNIGLDVREIENHLIIHRIDKNSPFHEQLQTGDVIIEIDEVTFENKRYDEYVSFMYQKLDQEITMTLLRPATNETYTMTTYIENIPENNVVSDVYEEDDQLIGYLVLKRFAEGIETEFFNELHNLEDNYTLDGLIIDIRNNPGGHLGTLITILDHFLIENELPMFRYRFMVNGFGHTGSEYATGSERKPYDIVVLINEFSASASEVFASAMQEQGNYTIIGTKSYGKGTISYTHTLDNGDILIYSGAQWFTPNNQWINYVGGDIQGIDPTVKVHNPYQGLSRIFLTVDEVYTLDQVSEKISQTQKLLNLIGYELRTDGYFDQATMDAITDFQINQALPKTGTIDVSWIEYLNRAFLDALEEDKFDYQKQAAIENLTQ